MAFGIMIIQFSFLAQDDDPKLRLSFFLSATAPFSAPPHHASSPLYTTVTKNRKSEIGYQFTKQLASHSRPNEVEKADERKPSTEKSNSAKGVHKRQSM